MVIGKAAPFSEAKKVDRTTVHNNGILLRPFLFAFLDSILFISIVVLAVKDDRYTTRGRYLSSAQE